ncbi:MAG: folylpolyglutamate synthase/dihydrofolate synthase family protein [Nakamurella multipartita]
MTGGPIDPSEPAGRAGDPLGWDADAVGALGPDDLALHGEDEAEIAAATADLDDQAPDGTTALVPDSPPLTLGYVESLLDTRRNEVQISPTLDRISLLLDMLGHPERSYPVILIAGTNGKTSTARMIDALLSRFGLRTGRFTSPHLQSVTERIALDGEPISADRYVQAYSDLAPFVELVDQASARTGGVPLSKFEILTAMAYAVFADAPVDVAVVEVGLGGTWDSTNVADARVAVITPVGIDHIEFLGSTLREIATNKAGIVKPDSVAVIGAQEPDAMTAILRRTVEVDAAVARFGSEFAVLERSFAVGGQRLTLQGLGGVYEDIFLPLSGEHQAANAAGALAAVEVFFGAGATRQLDLGPVQDGFAAAAAPGRLERVRTSPTIMVDAAHNPHGAAALAAALAAEFSFTRLVGVLAVLGDKDVHGILEALADSFDEVVVTRNSSPRSMPPAELAALAEDVFGDGVVHVADRMDDAIALAVELAETGVEDTSGTGVVITGSVVSAGDGRALAGLGPA